MKNNYFKSKSVLVTGGLGHLGKSITTRLAAKGVT